MQDAWLEPLTLEDCLSRLRIGGIGRVGVADTIGPLVLPVTYRLVEQVGLTWIAIRTRPGNVLDQPEVPVAFEIDGIDPTHRSGWSVVVRGILHHVDPDAAGYREHFDTHPWLAEERDAWLVIEPFAITGRVLHPREQEWAFHLAAYL